MVSRFYKYHLRELRWETQLCTTIWTTRFRLRCNSTVWECYQSSKNLPQNHSHSLFISRYLKLDRVAKEIACDDEARQSLRCHFPNTRLLYRMFWMKYRISVIQTPFLSRNVTQLFGDWERVLTGEHVYHDEQMVRFTIFLSFLHVFRWKSSEVTQFTICRWNAIERRTIRWLECEILALWD